MQGKIIKGIAGFYYVQTEDKLYECKAKGIFRNKKMKPLVGDNVEIDILDEAEQEGNITKIYERHNELIRPAVSNVDQALIIFAAKNPKPNYNLLDRFLMMMEKQDVPVIVCFNKVDLAKEKELKLLEKVYENCGHIVRFISVKEEEGIDEIRELIHGKTTVLAGPSGVGKSSLMNLLQPEAQMETGEVSEKITAKAARLVEVGEQIEKELGIPIINKRISVTPIAIVSAACKCSPVPFAHAMDRAAKDVGVNLIGGYTALVPKGFSAGDIELIKSIPEALATTERVCSSVNIGSTKTGINLDACKMMGGVVRECAERTVDSACFGAAKLVVFCNAVEDNPFMAGAFHGVGEPDCMINVGVSGPGVVRAALRKYPDADITKISDVIKEISYKITRVGQLVGTIASKRLGVPFGIVDLSLAPTPAVGDSVAHILEEIGLEKCGTHGTTAALALLNDAVKKGGVMACSRIGGLSGAFIPVSEDAGMIDAAKSGALCIEKLEAMTAVCSVGLDMICIPGDTPADTISAIIADEAAIGMVNNKTTAVRVIPAIGKGVGEELDWGGLFGCGPVMPLKKESPSKFINRGGQIPAPLHSLKN